MKLNLINDIASILKTFRSTEYDSENHDNNNNNNKKLAKYLYLFNRSSFFFRKDKFTINKSQEHWTETRQHKFSSIFWPVVSCYMLQAFFATSVLFSVFSLLLLFAWPQNVNMFKDISGYINSLNTQQYDTRFFIFVLFIYVVWCTCLLAFVWCLVVLKE